MPRTAAPDMSHYWDNAPQLIYAYGGFDWVFWSFWLAIVLMGALAGVKLVKMVFGGRGEQTGWPPRIS